eukprot:RCo050861
MLLTSEETPDPLLRHNLRFFLHSTDLKGAWSLICADGELVAERFSPALRKGESGLSNLVPGSIRAFECNYRVCEVSKGAVLSVTSTPEELLRDWVVLQDKRVKSNEAQDLASVSSPPRPSALFGAPVLLLRNLLGVVDGLSCGCLLAMLHFCGSRRLLVESVFLGCLWAVLRALFRVQLSRNAWPQFLSPLSPLSRVVVNADEVLRWKVPWLSSAFAMLLLSFSFVLLRDGGVSTEVLTKNAENAMRHCMQIPGMILTSAAVAAFLLLRATLWPREDGTRESRPQPTFYDPNGTCPRVQAAVPEAPSPTSSASLPPASAAPALPSSGAEPAAEAPSEDDVQQILEGLKASFPAPGTRFEYFRSDFLAVLLQRYGPKAALEKAKTVMEWRLKTRVDTLREEEFAAELQMGAMHWHGRDREGRPVFYARPAKQDMSKYDRDRTLRAAFFLLEGGFRDMPPGVTSY